MSEERSHLEGQGAPEFVSDTEQAPTGRPEIAEPDPEVLAYEKVWGEPPEQAVRRRRSSSTRKAQKVWGPSQTKAEAPAQPAARHGSEDRQAATERDDHPQRQRLHFGLTAGSMFLALVISALLGSIGMFEFASVGATGRWQVPTLSSVYGDRGMVFDLVDQMFGIGVGIGTLGIAFAVLRKKV